MASIFNFIFTLLTIYFALQILRWLFTVFLIAISPEKKNRKANRKFYQDTHTNFDQPDEKDISSEVKIIEEKTNEEIK